MPLFHNSFKYEIDTAFAFCEVIHITDYVTSSVKPSRKILKCKFHNFQTVACNSTKICKVHT